jgi:hypothetical protein
MTEYALKAKCGETIKKIEAESLDLAVEFFATMKRLTPSLLLGIFSVEKVF